MKISCKVEAFYKVKPTKIHKEYWNEIYDISDATTFIEQGHEVKYRISIIAHDGNMEKTLQEREFTKTGKGTKHNISFLSTTFQYCELSGDIVCLNQYINI